MITLVQVSGEFRGLIERRRRQLTFLFSTAAALSLLVTGSVNHQLPPPFFTSDNAILSISCGFLAIIAFLTTLREARLYRGLIYNGYLYDVLLRNSNHIQRPSNKFNPLGVSFCLFLVALSTLVVTLYYTLSLISLSNTVCIGTLAFFILFPLVYFRSQHVLAHRLARSRVNRDICDLVTISDWHAHIIHSIDDAHKDMLELIALVSIITFCGFQALVIYGTLATHKMASLPSPLLTDAPYSIILSYLTISSLLALIAYIRLRYAIGDFSLILDPWDRPFRVFSFDDSFFGLLILIAIFSADLFLLFWAGNASPTPRDSIATIMVIACGLIVTERIAIYIFKRKTTTSIE